MKEKIQELWLLCEMGLESYNTHEDDDLGRLTIIGDRIKNLIELKNNTKTFVDYVKHSHYLCE